MYAYKILIGVRLTANVCLFYIIKVKELFESQLRVENVIEAVYTHHLKFETKESVT